VKGFAGITYLLVWQLRALETRIVRYKGNLGETRLYIVSLAMYAHARRREGRRSDSVLHKRRGKPQ